MLVLYVIIYALAEELAKPMMYANVTTTGVLDLHTKGFVYFLT